MPTATLLAGPNGAGKSTLLPRLALTTSVERILTDTLAETYRGRGVSLQNANLRAGRDVVRRLQELERERTSFIYETNLVGRVLVYRLARLQAVGYHVEVIFVGLRHMEAAVARVHKRVQSGGHEVPETTVRRRWAAGLRLFFSHYRFAADSWSFYDNEDEFILVASGDHSEAVEVARPDIWHEYMELVASL